MNKKLITIAITTLFAGTLAAQDGNSPNPGDNSDNTNRSFRNTDRKSTRLNSSH